jgi:glycosyltransferase involved in cell wall biosynthesis
MPPPCVAVFAHNEERRVRRCLESLTQASRDPSAISIKVLVNGSTDDTEHIVRKWAVSHPNVEAVVIHLGDKANAWNTYVCSGLAFDRNHYFLDGDCHLPPLAIDLLEEEFAKGSPLCVAPLPRNVSESLRHLLSKRSLPCGTMYGLTGEFLRRIVADGIRMPAGFIGDDNLIASLVHSDLDDRFENYDRSRVRIVESLGPIIHRPPTWSREMFNLQRRRLRRYALRRVQMELLNTHVRKHGLRSLPSTARELSRYWQSLGLPWFFRWRGPETPFVLQALWKVSTEARKLRLTRTAPCSP